MVRRHPESPGGFELVVDELKRAEVLQSAAEPGLYTVPAGKALILKTADGYVFKSTRSRVADTG
jgi:hypothetical protein